MRGAVRVIRRWRVNDWYDPVAKDFRPVLSALVMPYDYVPGVNTAVDLSDEGFGWAGDGPGFYGYFRPKWSAQATTSLMSVTGSLLGFGKVVLHEDGARCGRGVVEALAMPSRDQLVDAVDYYNKWSKYEYWAEALLDEDGAPRPSVTVDEVWERYERLAVYYDCLLVPWDVLMGMPTGLLEGQPVRGVQF